MKLIKSFLNIMLGSVTRLLTFFLSPKLKTDEEKRKEYIFNVLILSCIFLFFFSIIVNLAVSFCRPDSYKESAVSLIFLFCMLFLLFFLHFLSRRGYFKTSASVFISLFYFTSLFMSVKWGVDVNASILLYILSIVMTGILLNAKFAFSLTTLIGLSMFAVGYLQTNEIIIINSYWRTEEWTLSDTFITLIIFIIIGIVSWISNKEIDRSLARAYKSEKLLRKERDELEKRVVERTKELREAQIEKISQLYRFAEFGRLSSGIFHDLMNPLSALSLNIEKVKEEKETKGNVVEALKYLNSAIKVANKMKSLVVAIKKQINKQREGTLFSLRENVYEVIDLLSYKSNLNNVNIVFHPTADPKLYGEEMKWNQVILNLISNSIDSYDEISRSEKRKVIIYLKEDSKEIIFSLQDYGIGIKKENLQKIFEPFFSTKKEKETKGTGLGLSMTKDIIEKYFQGTISVKSEELKGSTFYIIIPKNN